VLGDGVDLVGDEPVSLPVHGVRGLRVRRVDQAEDLPRLLVHPVAQVSEAAIARVAAGHEDAAFLRADVRRLPFQPHCFDAAIDRGCLHYLPPDDRLSYAGELRRVLRPGAKFLLRASLRMAGQRNDVDEAVIARTFAGWQIERMERAEVPSDTRMLDVLLARLATR